MSHGAAGLTSRRSPRSRPVRWSPSAAWAAPAWSGASTERFPAHDPGGALRPERSEVDNSAVRAAIEGERKKPQHPHPPRGRGCSAPAADGRAGQRAASEVVTNPGYGSGPLGLGMAARVAFPEARDPDGAGT